MEDARTLFAIDCGATNWRLYRALYGGGAFLLGEPSPSPLTSFVDRRLPAVLQLAPDGKRLECYGEAARAQAEDESGRARTVEYFKPCIGAHLLADPQPHQLRCTHTQALEYTRLLLEAVLAGLLKEKWRAAAFDERALFTFSLPVHWQTAHGGKIFEDFTAVVRSCFDGKLHDRLRFVTEPEAAILALQRQGHLRAAMPGQVSLLVDMGGSTTDLVTGEVDPASGQLNFIGQYGAPFGGGHYDTLLADSIAEEMRLPAEALAEDPGILLALRGAARGLKESLSRQMLFDPAGTQAQQRAVTLVLRGGEVYRATVRFDAVRFAQVTAPLAAEFDRLLETGLQAMHLRAEEIGALLLVGGGAQLFSILRSLQARFPGRDITLADNPDECVALGCSLEYGAAAARARPSLLFLPGAVPLAQPAPTTAFQLEGEAGWLCPLHSGENSIGRAPTNDVHLEGDRVSRFHARLTVSPGGARLVDAGSRNGTFVNETRLQPEQSAELQPGDALRFGDVKVKFQPRP